MIASMQTLFEEWASKRNLKLQKTKEGRYVSKDTFTAYHAWEGAYTALLGSYATTTQLKQPLRDVLMGTTVSVQLSDDPSEKGLRLTGVVEEIRDSALYKNEAVLCVNNPFQEGNADPRIAKQQKLMDDSQEIIEKIFKLGQESKEASINDSLETVVEIDLQLMEIKEAFRLATVKPDFSDPNVYEKNND